MCGSLPQLCTVMPRDGTNVCLIDGAKMKRILYRFAICVVLAAMVAAFATPVFADAPAPDKQTAKFEIKFMENMIDHHAMAVMMAEMCTMMAVHPELIAMCEDIIATQSAEIEMMQMWLQDWYGITYEPDMHMGEMEGYMKMDPAQFEEWFMKRMISHHATAIKEAEDCLEEAYHPELLSNTMQAWLCEWYGVCNYRKNL
jgi:uncharacterized protein (DUF305 family)